MNRRKACRAKASQAYNAGSIPVARSIDILRPTHIVWASLFQRVWINIK